MQKAVIFITPSTKQGVKRVHCSFFSCRYCIRPMLNKSKRVLHKQHQTHTKTGLSIKQYNKFPDNYLIHFKIILEECQDFPFQFVQHSVQISFQRLQHYTIISFKWSTNLEQELNNFFIYKTLLQSFNLTHQYLVYTLQVVQYSLSPLVVCTLNKIHMHILGKSFF